MTRKPHARRLIPRPPPRTLPPVPKMTLIAGGNLIIDQGFKSQRTVTRAILVLEHRNEQDRVLQRRVIPIRLPLPKESILPGNYLTYLIGEPK